MDVNEVYRRLAEISEAGNRRALTEFEAAEMVALFATLDEWIKKGGFPPKAWTTDWPAFAREHLARARQRKEADHG